MTINRIFSPPPDHEPEWKVNIGNTARTEKYQGTMPLVPSWRKLDTVIGAGSYATSADHLLSDAKLRKALRVKIESR